MKRIVFLSLLFILTGCINENKKANVRYITVSILPQKYIIEQIAGESFRVNVLVPDGNGPETYEPTGRQMLELGESHTYFTMGLMDFEKNMIPKLHDLYPDLDVVNVSNGINLLKGEHHHENETADNNEPLAHDGSVIHSGIDPHIWLSFKTVKIQSDNVLDYLIKKFPGEKELFINNHKKFSSRLDSLDQLLTKRFSELPGQYCFMIYHPSLSYFAKDYGILQIPIELEGKEPSPAYLKELIDIAKEKNLRTIFYSEQFDKKSAKTLAGQLGISLTPFNPLAENIESNLLSISEAIIKSNE